MKVFVKSNSIGIQTRNYFLIIGKCFVDGIGWIWLNGTYSVKVYKIAMPKKRGIK